MMTNIEHDLLVGLRNLHDAQCIQNQTGREETLLVRQKREAAQRLLRKHDPEWTCPVCDGGPGNNCACGCPRN